MGDESPDCDHRFEFVPMDPACNQQVWFRPGTTDDNVLEISQITHTIIRSENAPFVHGSVADNQELSHRVRVSH